MDLKLQTRMIDEIPVCRMNGRLTLSNYGTLRDHVKKLFGEGAKFLILDVSDLHYIDSSGLGELLSIFTVARNRGGNMVVVNPVGRVKDALTVTKMYSFLPIHPTVEEALQFLAMAPVKEKP